MGMFSGFKFKKAASVKRQGTKVKKPGVKVARNKTVRAAKRGRK